MTPAWRQRAIWMLMVIVVIGAFVVGLAGGDDQPPTEAERAYSIKETTLCPICDGQNVLESNAPIAASIRAQIDELVQNGDTDAEIRGTLARQFGDDVNGIPPSTGWGALVWMIPVAGAVIGAGSLIVSIRRWKLAGSRRATEEDISLVESARSESS